MSSRYRRICLDHNPPLVIDDEGESHPTLPPPRPEAHQHCRLALGRYSYPLIEIWLPTPYFDKDGRHLGRWYDADWLRRFPEVGQAIIGGTV